MDEEIFYCPICGDQLDILNKTDEGLIQISCKTCEVSNFRSSNFIAGHKVNLNKVIERALISYCEHAISEKGMSFWSNYGRKL